MKTELIGFKVSPEEKEYLVKLAQEKDVPVSQIIREIIKQYKELNK